MANVDLDSDPFGLVACGNREGKSASRRRRGDEREKDAESNALFFFGAASSSPCSALAAAALAFFDFSFTTGTSSLGAGQLSRSPTGAAPLASSRKPLHPSPRLGGCEGAEPVRAAAGRGSREARGEDIGGWAEEGVGAEEAEDEADDLAKWEAFLLAANPLVDVLAFKCEFSLAARFSL